MLSLCFCLRLFFCWSDSSLVYSDTFPGGQQMSWPLKALLCPLPAGSFEDNLFRARWQSRQVEASGSQTHIADTHQTVWVTGQTWMILYLAAFSASRKCFWKRALPMWGSSPFRWRQTQEFISMMNCSLCSINQSGKGTNTFAWVTNSVHVCEVHFCNPNKVAIFSL